MMRLSGNLSEMLLLINKSDKLVIVIIVIVINIHKNWSVHINYFQRDNHGQQEIDTKSQQYINLKSLNYPLLSVLQIEFSR